MTKLIVAIIGQDCADWLEISLRSISNVADKIIFIDGGSKDNTVEIAQSFCADVVIDKYDKNYKGMNGKQRNKYLGLIKKNYNGWWCLVLDPDEVVEGIEFLKENLESECKDVDIMDVKMIHLIGDLAHEDSTLDEHFVPRRLFKVTDDLFYEEKEHPILQFKEQKSFAKYAGITIWHFSYAKHMIEIYNKYKNHLKKSDIHSKEFLRWWYLSHLFGAYPKKEIEISRLPKEIIKKFEIEDAVEEIYFRRRMGLEVKHFIDAVHWKKFFNPEKVLDLGCGTGLRLFALNEVGVNAFGIDKSKVALEMSSFQEYRHKMLEGDIKELSRYYSLKNSEVNFDLIIGYDVLEHLEEKDLETALKEIYKIGSKNFLFSIPFLGDPNLGKDSTHRIKRSKEWWLEKIQNAGFKIVSVPEYFLFKEQLVRCVK